MNRTAVLSAVTEEFKLNNSVDVGDILLSVQNKNTSELTAAELAAYLAAGVTVFRVIRKELFRVNTLTDRRQADHARHNTVEIPKSREQASLEKNGFYTIGK